MAYTNTYTTVTWTSGDTITETKMDNMVSNDSAYDSHTSSGFQLDNNVGYSQENAAGTRKVIANLNASDEIQIGVDGENDHTVINAGTSKLVKIKVLRQDDTSDSYKASSVILTGWGIIQGDSTTKNEEAVSFGITFDDEPAGTVANYAGFKGSSPSGLDDVAEGTGLVQCTAREITTSGFSLNIEAAAGLGTSYYAYTWISIGELA